MTMWPEKGSFCHMKSKAALSFSGGIFQATRAPWARLMDMRVRRTRRMVPAASMAMMRSATRWNGRLAELAIWARGSGTKPWILSSEMARIWALVGSVVSMDVVVGILGSVLSVGRWGIIRGKGAGGAAFLS